ncbi:hypothetical protein N7499_010134 [Penicillium canescens]|nr:hypothetical protein N7499_010134 [Penicillium canescens]
MDVSQSLKEACAHPDSLFARSEEDLINLVYKEFPQDIDRLKRAYSIRDGPWTPPSTPSPSYIIYKENYDEVNRTLVGFLALRWIHTDQYETFIGTQSPAPQLTRESFDWIRQFYAQVITDANTLYTLIYSIIINDLGKDPQLAIDYHTHTGEDISALNHDAILLQACKHGLIYSLDTLPAQDREDVFKAIQLGATFNFGQLAQAENAPACLTALLEMKSSKRSFQIRFMEQILDIAGAAGHMDWTCAQKLIQPIFEGYRHVYEVYEGVTTGTLTLRSGYNWILIRRAEFLCLAEGVRAFNVEWDPRDRALMRLFCLGNVTTRDKALLYEAAWDALDEGTRGSWKGLLMLMGLRASLLFSRRICPLYLGVWDPEVVVIERSVYKVLKEVVESEAFQNDPTILEGVDVPEGVVVL